VQREGSTSISACVKQRAARHAIVRHAAAAERRYLAVVLAWLKDPR
jgi:hypothetical protein